MTYNNIIFDHIVLLSLLIIFSFIISITCYNIFLSVCVEINVIHLSLLLFLLINLGFSFGLLLKQKKINCNCLFISIIVIIINILIIIEYNHISDIECDKNIPMSILLISFYISNISLGLSYGILFMIFNHF